MNHEGDISDTDSLQSQLSEIRDDVSRVFFKVNRFNQLSRSMEEEMRLLNQELDKWVFSAEE